MLSSINLKTHLVIIGMLLILLGLIHIIFPSYFKWKSELKHLSLMNREMMQVHTFFIALTVILMGLLCLCAPTDLIDTSLGKKISLGLGVFWGIRLFCQIFVYSSALWRGKTLETIVHIFSTLSWMYFSGVFLINYLIPFVEN